MAFVDDPSGQPNPLAGAHLRELIEAFDTVLLAYIGVASGMFNVIAEHGVLNSERIATILSYSGLLVNAYCEAATAYGLLEQIENNFQLSKFTIEENVVTTGSIIWRGHRAYLLSLLPKVLEGTRVKIDPYISQLESKGCSCLASSCALSVLKRICPMTAGKCDILDLGAGQGTYLIDLLKLHPESTGVGVEVDPVLVKNIKSQLLIHGLTDRALIIQSDVRTFESEQKFDLVLLNSMLHYLTVEERYNLIARGFNWLREGGYVTILEQPKPEDVGELRKFKRRLILNLEFIAIHNTGLPTFREITDMLLRYGFKNIETYPIDPTDTSVYIQARKPKQRE
jgi:SAM-dependent methyltransferase